MDRGLVSLLTARSIRAGKSMMSAKAAVAWFLRDMATVAGYRRPGWQNAAGFAAAAPHLAGRNASGGLPPDPSYLAGLVALEPAKIAELYPREEASVLMQEITAQIDGVAGRRDLAVSTLVLTLIGRIGLASLLSRRKVPDH